VPLCLHKVGTQEKRIHRIIKTLLEALLKGHGTGEHDEIVKAVIAGDPEAA
jgi:hypothetical protein